MSNWIEKNNRLEATFVFADFRQAFAFMTEAAFYAEQHNHHPEWTNVYNRLHIGLSTHDAGGIVTEKDRALAVAFDQVYSRYQR